MMPQKGVELRVRKITIKLILLKINIMEMKELEIKIM